jgi:Glycoside hydrolase family 44
MTPLLPRANLRTDRSPENETRPLTGAQVHTPVLCNRPIVSGIHTIEGEQVSMRLYGLISVICCATSSLLVCACSATDASDSTSGPAVVTVSVNPASKHPISPYIYGINFATKIDGVPTALTLDRTGGNRWTAYNWETNASNAGSDYLYQNDNFLGNSKEPGGVVTELIADDRKNGMASMITVQMQGLVAGDQSGPVNVANPPDKARFKKSIYAKNSVSNESFTTKPSTSDDSVYMDEFLWALDHKFADQNIFGLKPTTQPVFVSLDNEPELWNHTHLEIQGKTGITADSYIAKTISLATALKKQFPDLVIFGPAHYGFMGIYSWSQELNATATGNNWFTDKYLMALKAASTAAGRPLVDVYDFHWYPEATDSAGTRVNALMSPSLTDDQVQAIVQSPRSLWDKTYKEKSWIAKDVLGQPVNILGRLQSRIDAENPGMKLALTEYNNGGGQHIAGTIAQADNLGVFGARALFAATMWPLSSKEPYSLAGFRAFRNFDGANHHFGDTSIEATSSDASKVVVYVSTDSSRAGRVIMVAINRSPMDQEATITGQPLSGAAHLFQMTAASAAKQFTVRPIATGVQPVSGASIMLALPALSVTTIDIY